MTENIIQRAFRKIRPGSGGPAKAISIIDGQTGRAPTIAPVRGLPGDDAGEDFENPKSGMPLALSLQYGAGAEIRMMPTGTLPGVDKDGNIPYHAPDDSAVLNRLFNLRVSDD